MSVSPGCRMSVCPSCPWSVLCGFVPSPLRPSWSVARHPSPPHPRLEGRSIWGGGGTRDEVTVPPGDGKLPSRAPRQNKTKAHPTLAPQVPTRRTPTLLTTPPLPRPTSASGPPGGLSLGICQASAAATTRKTSSSSRPGEGAVWCGFGGKGGIWPRAKGRGPSWGGAHSPLLTLASLHPTAAASTRLSWKMWEILG